jgi:leucyl aminopeptidase
MGSFMEIRFAAVRPDGDYALVIPVAGKDQSALARLAEAEGVKAALSRQRFEGEPGGSAELFIRDGGETRRLIAAGTGIGPVDSEAAEKLGSVAVSKLLTSGERSAVIDLTEQNFSMEAAARTALAAALRSWRYDRYRTKLKDNQKPSLQSVTLVGAPDGAEQRFLDRYQAVIEGVKLTRELVTEPANIIYPETFVERCDHLRELGVEIEVLDGAGMRELGMGALLGVAQGSVRDPRLLVMRWNGGKEGGQPVAFVGKGVTFDTGGISIKPAQGMEAMKWDMGGAGAVAGAMKTLALRKARANIVGICGLVENMPSGNAQRPGDVVTSMSGQTVEVINTDAEGRLVLADAITYVQQTYKPSIVIDLATLTGAILVALGHEYAGLFTPDDALAADLTRAADSVGEKLWRQPMADAFDRMIDSPIADMKNVGPREGGSITAAQFIKRFVDEGVRWAHLDIAGTVWSDKPGTTYDKGATGFGVRLLDQYVADRLEA